MPSPTNGRQASVAERLVALPPARQSACHVEQFECGNPRVPPARGELRTASRRQTDPKLKSDFLDLELRWLFLARSYEFTHRLADFSDETKRRVAQRPARE